MSEAFALRLSPIIVRLKAQVTDFKDVGGAAELASIDKIERFPAAYVIPGSNRAGPNVIVSAGVDQRYEEQFGVVIAHKNVRDTRGAQAADETAALRAKVRDALLNWTHPDADEQTEGAGGQLLRFVGTLLYVERFRTAYRVRKVS